MMYPIVFALQYDRGGSRPITMTRETIRQQLIEKGFFRSETTVIATVIMIIAIIIIIINVRCTDELIRKLFFQLLVDIMHPGIRFPTEVHASNLFRLM